MEINDVELFWQGVLKSEKITRAICIEFAVGKGELFYESDDM